MWAKAGAQVERPPLPSHQPAAPPARQRSAAAQSSQRDYKPTEKEMMTACSPGASVTRRIPERGALFTQHSGLSGKLLRSTR